MENSYQHTTVNILPTHYISVHQSAIRAITWIRTPPTESSGAFHVDADPTVIATGGYDGLQCLTDIREGAGCVMNRTRGETFHLPAWLKNADDVIRYNQHDGILTLHRRPSDN
jgi:hypothetical protein